MSGCRRGPNEYRDRGYPSQEEFEKRFWSRVVKTDTCWLWQGRPYNGYGRINYQGRGWYAHRLSWLFAGGELLAGLHLDHLCRVQLCVNPAHLEQVTAAVNVMRGIAPPAMNAKKTHCPRGHAYDEANTYISPDGYRVCRACQRAYQQMLRDKRKAAA